MEDVRGVSPLKFQLQVEIEDDDRVKVACANPGEVSPWLIVGVLEKIKLQLLLAAEESE